MSKLEPTRTYSNPTATDILRRLLDERGVEHYDGTESTLWGYEPTSDSTGAYRYSADETSDGYMQVRLWRVTPEQAIAATLGAGTCHDLAVTPAYSDKTKFECSECGYEYSAVGGFGCDYGDEPYFNYCPNCGRRIVQ